MAIQPRAASSPPHRPWYVDLKPPSERLTYLLIEELERLMETREKRDSAVVRSFLAKFRALSGAGNVMAAELSIGKGRGNAAVLYAHSPGAGVIRWVPALVVPMSTRLDRIMRECGKGRRFEHQVERERDVWGALVPQQAPVIPAVAIQLLSIRP